jgi:preprotein translocase subunit SecD
VPRRPTYRPGARILVVLGAMAALYIGMVGSGHTTPKLGLDLEGGTTVTLTPQGKVSSGQLSAAVDIIRQRVNGLGVSEADVVRQGNHVVISVPGKGRSDVLKVVGQTASLSFREIVGSTVGTPTPTTSATPTPGASTTPTPGASVTPGASTTPGASAATAGATSSTTSAGRVAAQALEGAETPTPTPTPTTTPTSATGATPTPTPSGSTAPAAAETTPSDAELAAFSALDCSQNGGRPPVIDDNPKHFVVACDRSQNIKYLLKPADIVGTDVSSASGQLQLNSQGIATGAWVVELVFKNSAISKVASVSGRLFNDNQAPLAITLDGVVQSAPSTNGVLGKNVEISGGASNGFTQKEAKDLGNVLKYGSLPVPFKQSNVESVSATLGSSSLHAGLLAGALGLALVLIYVFLYYRALGLITVASLSVSAGLVYGCVTLLGQAIGFTLTLAGIAGLIVSVGITADSFVVFFERIKDEIHEGRSPRQAVEYGWVRARRTIYSADTVSFLAALVLYEVSIGSVRGFAFTLGLSTLLDVFVVLLFTKPVMTLLIKRKFFSTSNASGLASIRAEAAHRAPSARSREA